MLKPKTTFVNDHVSETDSCSPHPAVEGAGVLLTVFKQENPFFTPSITKLRSLWFKCGWARPEPHRWDLPLPRIMSTGPQDTRCQ